MSENNLEKKEYLDIENTNMAGSFESPKGIGMNGKELGWLAQKRVCGLFFPPVKNQRTIPRLKGFAGIDLKSKKSIKKTRR